MTTLDKRHCLPCEGGVSPMRGAEIGAYLQQLGDGWMVVGAERLEKGFDFPDFITALAFTNRVGSLAEAEGHHPDIDLRWGHVGVTIWTHAVKGLTENDFILAAKVHDLETPLSAVQVA